MPLPRSRRGRVAAVLLVVVVAALAYAWSTPPLAAGNSGVVTGPPEPSPPAVTPDVSDVPPRTSIAFVADGRVAFGVEVRNQLVLPVTVTGLPSDAFPEDGPLVAVAAYSLRDPNVIDASPTALRPFEPTTLAPGASAFIVVVGRFPDCATAVSHFFPGTGASYDAIPLVVSVLGLPRTVAAPLLERVELLAPETRSCPV